MIDTLPGPAAMQVWSALSTSDRWTLLSSGRTVAAAFGPCVRRLTSARAGGRAADPSNSPILRYVTLLHRADLGTFESVGDAARAVALVGPLLAYAGDLALRIDAAPRGAADLSLVCAAITSACPLLARLRLSVSFATAHAHGCGAFGTDAASLLGALVSLPQRLTSLSLAFDVDAHAVPLSALLPPIPSLVSLKHIEVEVSMCPSPSAVGEVPTIEAETGGVWLETFARTLLAGAPEARTVTFSHLSTCPRTDACIRMTPALARSLSAGHGRSSIASLRLPSVRITDSESAVALFSSLPCLSMVGLRSLEGVFEYPPNSVIAPLLRSIHVIEGHRHSVRLQPVPEFLRPLLAAILRFAPALEQFTAGATARIVRHRPYLDAPAGQTLWRAEFYERSGDSIGVILYV